MSVFRKSALDKLSSPEQLDKLIKMTSPRSWMVLAFFVLIILATLLWSFTGSIPKKIQAQGIMLSNGGADSVFSSVDGVISDVTIQEYDYVKVGDTIARISQSAAAGELEKVEAEIKEVEGIKLDNQSNETHISENAFNLYDIKNKINDLNSQIAKMKKGDLSDSLELQKYNADLELRQEELKTAIKNVERKEFLLKQGAIAKTEYEQAVSGKETAENNLKSVELSFDSQLKDLTTRKATLIESFNATKSSRLDTLSKNRLDLKQNLKDSEIVSSVEGQVLSVNITKGNIVQKGVEIAKILKKGKDVNETGAIFYVPIEQGKKLVPGMVINVYPTTINRQEYGHMISVITSVSKYAVSTEDMRRKLGNDDLVNLFLKGGVPVEVEAYLIKDESTESGYYWSSKKGKTVSIAEGTICDASITIEVNKPIALVIPLLKEKISPFEK